MFHLRFLIEFQATPLERWQFRSECSKSKPDKVNPRSGASQNIHSDQSVARMNGCVARRSESSCMVIHSGSRASCALPFNRSPRLTPCIEAAGLVSMRHPHISCSHVSRPVSGLACAVTDTTLAYRCGGSAGFELFTRTCFPFNQAAYAARHLKTSCNLPCSRGQVTRLIP